MISHKMHPMLSQELYFQIPVFEKINTHQRTFYFFASPKNGLNLPTLLADAVLSMIVIKSIFSTENMQSTHNKYTHTLN